GSGKKHHPRNARPVGKGARGPREVSGGSAPLVDGGDAELLQGQLSQRAIQRRPNVSAGQVPGSHVPRAEGFGALAGGTQRHLAVGRERPAGGDNPQGGALRPPRCAGDGDENDGPLADAGALNWRITAPQPETEFAMTPSLCDTCASMREVVTPRGSR